MFKSSADETFSNATSDGIISSKSKSAMDGGGAWGSTDSGPPSLPDTRDRGSGYLRARAASSATAPGRGPETPDASAAPPRRLGKDGPRAALLAATFAWRRRATA